MSSALGVCAGLVLAGVVAFVPTRGQAADPMSRYPYDPVCPWGRIGNGRGIIVRCLSQAEAVELASRTPPSAAASAPSIAPPTPVPDGGTADAAPMVTPLDAKVLRVTPDVGKLPEAEKKLSAARDRFIDCAVRNGGLETERGEVQVRFLVRARGRAEGVSVAKRSGLSAAAAQCIAEVVDRRAVGLPEEPIVGATVVIQLTGRSTGARSGGF